MPIRQGSENEIEVQYTLPNFGFEESKQEWKQQCVDDVLRSKTRYWVKRLCSVSTATHKFSEFTEVDAIKLGGRGNLRKLIDVGAVAEASEERVRTNNGEYELVVTSKLAGRSLLLAPGVPSERRTRTEGEGVHASEFDQPGEESFEAWDSIKRRMVLREGRPAVDGREIAEDLISKGYLRRAKLRDSAKNALKKRLTSKKAGSSAT